ncbi:MAG: LysR family transcriptional regulator [Alphaproteobacteria bacterium HGW-Alphaproteobacteria-6]|nr:MAG: LysR family transcriptional regulator [Alphaproteobacteria bacterium HGW-Alphaproteobacteria-6]
MQIELIETFLDLCETRSFNRSADRLGVTQSTVSGRIRALESLLGRRLFTRSRAGTDLTTEGLRFEPHARSLRHGWTEALHATRDGGLAAATMRIGIQNDLVGGHFSGLIADFRAAMPDTAFFFEADYSVQMCSDLVTGAADFAILFSPRIHPDLHFETLGEVTYRMVSTAADRLAAVDPATYILANYAPAFAQSHAALHPGLTAASLSIGQNAAMVALLRALGGAAYVLGQSADDLLRDRLCRPVADAPPIPQTIFAGVNMRHRHRSPQRRLMQILRRHFGTQPPAPRTRGRQAECFRPSPEGDGD